MAKYRTSNTALTKTFENTAALIYLVGDDRTIHYANPACSVWTGLEADSLFGVKLNYSSEEPSAKIENRLQGLCPPAEIFDDAFADDDQALEFYISLADDGIEKPELSSLRHWRLARAFRIANPEDDDFSILVVSGGDDLDSLPSDDSQLHVAKQLHAVLAEIRQQNQLSYRLDTLVGTSPFAQRIRRTARIAAESRADVLIIGPTGSGKEHLARTLHAAGPGAMKSEIVPLQCAVADQELIQTVVQELLKKRKHEPAAKKSTPADVLMLLEVDRLSVAAQVELWGFLRLPKFSLRIVATTARCLRELANAGQFEVELAHALSTLTVELLPLHQRAEDIPLLAQAILERRNGKREKQLAGFDAAALQLLTEYRWPGNLDQLSGIIRESAALAQASLLTAEDLPKGFHDAISAQRIGGATEETIDLDGYLASIERELLSRALNQAKGNKTKAAKLLSVNRARLLRRLQQLGLDSSVKFEPITDADEPDFTEPDAFEEIE